MEFVIWLIVGLAVGGAIGAFATWWISRARGGVVSVAELKKENEQFRNEVTEHFVETAQLINQLTDSYKAVFDHLSSGAEKLVDDEALAERLPTSSGQEVKLSHFGAPESAGSGKSKAKDDQRKDRGKDPGKDPGRDNRGSGSPGRRDAESKTPGNPDPLKSRQGGSGSGSEPQTAQATGAGADKGGGEAASKARPGRGPASDGIGQASDKPRSSD